MEWKDIAPKMGPTKIADEVNFTIATLRASGASDNALVRGQALALIDTIIDNANLGMGVFWLKEVEKMISQHRQALEEGITEASRKACH